MAVCPENTKGFSIPFCTAAAFTFGKSDMSEFQIGRLKILLLMHIEKVTVIPDEAFSFLISGSLRIFYEDLKREYCSGNTGINSIRREITLLQKRRYLKMKILKTKICYPGKREKRIAENCWIGRGKLLNYKTCQSIKYKSMNPSRQPRKS